MTRLEMKSNNTMLTEKQQKYLQYHEVKWINIISYRWWNTASGSKNRVIKHGKLTYSFFGKAFEKQIKTTQNEGKIN